MYIILTREYLQYSPTSLIFFADELKDLICVYFSNAQMPLNNLGCFPRELSEYTKGYRQAFGQLLKSIGKPENSVLKAIGKPLRCG